MAEPLVSVVISTRNRTELLMSRSLPSVLGQTYPNIEVLVVGDDTEPETAIALRELADPRVLFQNLPRQTLPDDPGQRWCVVGLEARNWGHEHAQGDYIAGLDDDDEFLPHMIETLIKELWAADADIAYGRSKAFGHDGSIAWYGNWPPGHFQFCEGAWVSKHDMGFRYDPACISRGLPEDGDRIDRMVAAKKKFVFVDQVVHYYYPNPR